MAPARPPAAMLLMSAYGVFSASRYSSTSGSSQNASPWFSPERMMRRISSRSVPMTPATLGPSARTHGAGEGGDVDHVGGALLARAVQAVGEHQPALGVGVVDHDRLAVLGREDVARALRVGVGEVLRAAQDAHHLHVGREAARARAW